MPKSVSSPQLVVRRQKTTNSEPKSTNYQLLTTICKSAGFTLIELLIVISIIAILVASATASWQNAQMKSRDGKRKVDLKAVQQALENYLQTNGFYPASTTGQIQCNTTTPSVDSSTKTWGTGSFTCAAINYMQQIPRDPVYQSTTGYYYTSSGTPPTSYVISAQLENTNDPDIPPKTTLPCTPAAQRNYCVANP